MSLPPLRLILLLLPLTLSGCQEPDERIMQLTQQTLAEQSRQNERLIAHSTQLAEAAQELVTADARTRDKLLQAHAQLQQTLQAQQAQLDSQREELEQERRAIAGDRVREPLIAQAITAASLILACLFPLGLAGYMLYCSQQAQAETAALNELLITEIVTETPLRLGHAPAPTQLPTPVVFQNVTVVTRTHNMSELSPVSRSNLRQGAIYMLVGLLWGMVIPASPFPRLALGAHIQLTAHGIMFLVAGLVILHLPIAKGGVSAKILIASPWLTWPVMLTEMVNGWWGARKTLPIAAAQAGAGGAEPWQETIVTVAHLIGAVVLIVYWGVIVAGLFSKSDKEEKATSQPTD